MTRTGVEHIVSQPLSDALNSGLTTAGPEDGDRRRILVVDDDADITRLLARLLEYLGQEVRVAHTGEAALNVSRDFKPQIVLCDISLAGGMNGYEVARSLRSAECVPHPMTVVAVTGYSEQEVQEATKRAGFDLHFTKPVTLTKLQNLLAMPNHQGMCS